MLTTIRTAIALALLLLVAGCDSTTPEEHLAKASAELQKGSYQAAVIELKNALKKDPQLVAARAQLGFAYLYQGDFASALKEYERALDLGGQSTAVRAGLVRSRLGLGRNQEVIGELAEAADRTLELDLLLAEAYLSSGELEAAEPLLQRGIDTASGLAGLGFVAWQQGDTATATERFAAAVQKPVDDPKVWLRKAEFELAGNQLEAAQNSFAEAAKFPAGRVLGDVGFVRALLADGQVEAAEKAITGAIEIAPNYPLVRYLEGLIRYQTKDFESAEAALFEVQRLFPEHEPTLYLMGLVKYQLGQLAQAEYSVSRFVAVQPGNESARKLLASISLEQDKVDAAIDALLPAGASSSDPQLLAMLGSALTQAGRASEANEYLSRAVELAPDGAAFRNQLALSLLSAGNEDLARSELEAAIDIDGDQVQSEYLIAMLKLRNGELDSATETINSIIAKSPDNPVGPNLLGAAALASGDREGAERLFREAIELDPGFAPALSNLARLLEQAGDVPAAEALFRQRLEAEPGDMAALLGLTDLLGRNQRYAEAIVSARAAVAADASSARARVALARLYQLNGSTADAEATVDSGLEQTPNSPDLNLLKAQLALAGGRPAEARGRVDRLQAMYANAPTPNPELALLLGRLQAQLGKRTVARSNFEAAVEGRGETGTRALLDLGRLNLADRRFAAVERQLEELVSLDNAEFAVPRTLLQADLAAAQGQSEAASQLYQSLREQGSREAVLRLAQLALQDGKQAEGIRLLEEQVAAEPGDQGARLLLSSVLLAGDQKDAAIGQYEQLADTGNPVVLNNLAWLYMEKGDERALATGERAYGLAPNNADVADTFGWILVQMGDVERGIEVLERSLSLGQRSPSAMYHLAVGQAKAGRVPLARDRLVQALQMGEFPEREDALALQKELSGP